MSEGDSSATTGSDIFQRELAAVVFTDVVSFSARMHADEDGTLKAVERDLGYMKQLSTEHNGRVLKSLGDGLLIHFRSIIDAVKCGMAFQKDMAKGFGPDNKPSELKHRVGIHLGDMVVTDDEVMGDSVNIASRLQSEAEPGGICISQTVYDMVKNKMAFKVTNLGPRELKNISTAVNVYGIIVEAAQETANHPFDKKEVSDEEGAQVTDAEEIPMVEEPSSKKEEEGKEKEASGKTVDLTAEIDADLGDEREETEEPKKVKTIMVIPKKILALPFWRQRPFLIGSLSLLTLLLLGGLLYSITGGSGIAGGSLLSDGDVRGALKGRVLYTKTGFLWSKKKVYVDARKITNVSHVKTTTKGDGAQKAYTSTFDVDYKLSSSKTSVYEAILTYGPDKKPLRVKSFKKK